MTAARVLLVEDHAPIGVALVSALNDARYDVQWCRDGRSAIAAADASGAFDLVVLDLGLPDLDGVDVCRALRSRLPGAVLVILTARDAEIDVVVGLEAGADDYLVKPVRTVEFLARLRAHLRRARTAPTDGPEHAVGPLRVDPATRQAWLGRHEIPLRARQFDLLARLAQDGGAAVSRETLMADVWDENWFGSTKTLDVHVAGLRRRIGDAAAGTGIVPPEIVTLRGYGYRLEPARDHQDAAREDPQGADRHPAQAERHEHGQRH